MCQLFKNEMWVEQNFGAADFGDERITERLLKMVSRIIPLPEASLPQQMESWKELKAAYRLLNNRKVTHKRLQTPHRAMVKHQAREGGNKSAILFIQDGSEIDLSSLKAAKGLGPIGNHSGLGMIMHSCLAVRYDAINPEVLGLAHQLVWEERMCL